MLLAAMVVARRDLLAQALASLILSGLGLWRFRDRLAASPLPARKWLGTGGPGLLVLSLVFVDITAYTLTGALSNLASRESLVDLAMPAALAILSTAGFIAAAATGLTRNQPQVGTRAAPWVAGAGVLAFVILLGLGIAMGSHPAPGLVPATLALETANMAFSDPALTAPAGEITLRLSNSDLFWHTFTVDALGVNVQAPVGGEREVTFTAVPGVYDFYCAIPGHALIGMTGTLTVR